jgi:protein N-terminal methyltransferase
MTSLPDFQRGIDYWTSVDASVDGVLGGFGTGPLPRVEQLSSRLFLLSLMPSLQLFSSPLATTQDVMQARDRYVALDVGAGVGRVTAEVLLPLVDDVITIEPVKHFIETAKKESMTSWRFFKDRRKTNLVSSPNSRGNTGKSNGSAVDSLGNAVTGDETGGKRVWFIQGALNDLDPAQPTQGNNARSLGVLGGTGADAEFGERAQEIAYDV